MASYTKLRDGSWGVRVEGKATVGMSVDVTKRDGSVKRETVSAVKWTGQDRDTGRDVSICAVVPSARPSPPASPRPAQYAKPAARRNWRPCGYPGCNPAYCDECDGQGMGARY